jgi:hypothetical protein
MCFSETPIIVYSALIKLYHHKQKVLPTLISDRREYCLFSALPDIISLEVLSTMFLFSDNNLREPLCSLFEYSLFVPKTSASL